MRYSTVSVNNVGLFIIAEVEEVCKRLMSHKGVEGVIIINQEGIPIKSTLEKNATIHHSAHLHQVAQKAKSTIREIDPQNELTFLRIRSNKHEILVAPGISYRIIYTVGI
ncbi:hypothetical protein KUTeg_019440 [Tegillarca granosa]|uniref:Dynein light chain roadblock n=1 Tax=Tegillarca granosa TaxID=220873 RepID=A0ABQ9EEL9_TEGGR|nr:hypothetical protein KUTeg_019440 [Tegillarca granosa]